MTGMQIQILQMLTNVYIFVTTLLRINNSFIIYDRWNNYLMIYVRSISNHCSKMVLGQNGTDKMVYGQNGIRIKYYG